MQFPLKCWPSLDTCSSHQAETKQRNSSLALCPRKLPSSLPPAPFNSANRLHLPTVSNRCSDKLLNLNKRAHHSARDHRIMDTKSRVLIARDEVVLQETALNTAVETITRSSIHRSETLRTTCLKLLSRLANLLVAEWHLLPCLAQRTRPRQLSKSPSNRDFLRHVFESQNLQIMPNLLTALILLHLCHWRLVYVLPRLREYVFTHLYSRIEC